MDDRVQQILMAIVRNYIHTAEPVGSRTLSKMLDISLSPASIRNVMADLAEGGFLEQPHTSSGRVPTTQAYRFFVDHLVTADSLPQEVKRLIDQRLGEGGKSLEEMLSQTTRLLADLTHFTGIVAAPRADRAKLKRIEFIKMGPRQIFVVLITMSNMVHNKVIEAAEDISQSNLNAITQKLNEQFVNRSLMEIRSQVMTALVEEKAQYDQILAHVVRLGKKAFDFPDTTELFVEGQSNLVKDFPDTPRLEGLLKALEEKLSLVDLLDRTLQANGVQIFIGVENSQQELKDCSIITSQYGLQNNFLGAIGVIGPTRMDYDRVIPIVDYTARILSQTIATA